MRKQNKKKKKSKTTFAKLSDHIGSHSRHYSVAATFVIFLLAVSYFYYLRQPSQAQFYSDASTVYGLDSQYGAAQAHAAGADFSLTVVANPPAAWMWGGSFPSTAHINLEIYHDGPLTYRPTAFSCGTAGSCTSGPAFHGNGPAFVVDDRRCVNLTSASIQASQITLMTIGYKMGTGGSYVYGGRPGSFEVRAHADWEAGSCGNANDWQNCHFVAQNMCGPNHRTGWPLAAHEGGPLPTPSPDPSPNPGGNPPNGPDGPGPGTEGPGESQNPGLSNGPSTTPSPGRSGGGGSSATTQGDSSAPVPSPTGQGTAEQPKLEPSPFFDGKLFVAGSSVSADDSTKAVSVGGFKLGYGWFYLAGGLVLVAVGGFFGWRWRLTRQHK